MPLYNYKPTYEVSLSLFVLKNYESLLFSRILMFGVFWSLFDVAFNAENYEY